VSTAGIDVGGTKILGLVLGVDGTELAEARVPTPRGADALVAALLGVVSELLAGAGPLEAVGVGVPGLVDRTGTLRFAPNLPGVVELPVARLVRHHAGVPVRVDNDATCAAWAEHEQGAGRGFDDLVLVTLGTGIGGGIVADGRVLRGAHGFAGEIGHTVVDRDGIACPCGRRGCWERYASGSGLGRMGRDAVYAGRGRRIAELAGDPEDVRGEHVTLAALEGDADALAVLAGLADWLAIGLVNVVNVLDTALLVIGGGLVSAGDALLEPTRRSFAARLLAAGHRPDVPIRPAAMGERAGAVGAALLAREAATGA
jgi:glucokinase